MAGDLRTTSTDRPTVGRPRVGPDLLDTDPVAVRRPWLPAQLAAGFDATTVIELAYIGVDEIVDEIATLTVAPWPAADGLGRLCFDGSASRGHLLVHVDELRQQLYAGWLQRKPRIGDVFGAAVAPEVEAVLAAGDDVGLDKERRLADALPGDVHDLSAEARTVAKLAYYAALAPVGTMETAGELGQVSNARPAAPRPPTRVRTKRWSGRTVPTTTAASETGREDAPPARWAVDAKRVQEPDPDGFLAELRANPGSLVYFLLNIGDGDSQLLLLPPDERHEERRAVIVDIGSSRKMPALVETLAGLQLLPDPTATRNLFPVVVATHPHDDHIGGMSEFLDTYARAGQISDFWEPGYYHPSAAFVEMMKLLEECGLTQTQPTSGLVRYLGSTRLTVLGPGAALRAAYDSFGVDVNDASITLKVEFPVTRVVRKPAAGSPHENRADLRTTQPWSLILGGDAQTRSWAQAVVDFPDLHRGTNAALYRELSAARGRDHLAAQIMKVSHHASKHGINLELIERVKPQLALVSSVAGGGKYNFPHELATDAIAEALRPTVKSQKAQLDDADLGIHYTSGLVQRDGGAKPLGSMAIVVPPKRGAGLQMWRFGDEARDLVDLREARRLAPIRQTPR